MKKFYFILYALALLCTACQDDLYDATYISNTEVSAHSSTADVLIYVCDQDGQRSRAIVEEFGVFLSINPNPMDKDERRSYVIEDKEAYTYKQIYNELGCYGCTINGLSANTTYYALPFISNRWGIVTGKVVSFTTDGTATVTTKAATQITTTSAQLNATVQVVGENVNLEKRGFVISTSNNPTIEGANVTNWAEVGKAGDYAVSITGLNGGTRYYFRGYVVVDKEVLYGNVLNFTTTVPEDKTITLHLDAATNITASTVDMHGSITIGKDAVGTITECGFICAQDAQPTVESLYRWWRFNADYNSDFNTWSGTHNLTGTINKLSANKLYYYRMYYKIGETYYYDTNIKSFTTEQSPQAPTYTVSQIMSIYNSLGLAAGETSSDTYTVRAYVTQWKSGYPDYQNADFWIDDSANGSTTMLMCFRLTGVYESDRRTLVVGDYIEAQNCHLMNYNGKAELKDGTFTVIKAASANVPSLSDFLGTYSCHAHRQKNNDYVDWNNVVISERNIGVDNPDYNILVEGLIYGQSSYAAVGKFDESNGFIRLFGGWYLGENPCTINAKGDTLLYPIFYPIYVDNSNNAYYLDGYNYEEVFGQILLKRNSDGTLIFSPSDKADINNRYANAYRFDYVRASNGTVTGYNTVLYLLDGTTLTKTSSASAPSREHQRAIKAQH